MYKITGNNTFEVSPDNNPAEGLIDGSYYNLDIQKIDSRTWHIIKDHKSYYVQWIDRSEDGKAFSLKINGQLLELAAKDHYDILLEQMGMSATNAARASKLKAPMPGKVLDVLIKTGQVVTKGEGLIILEAMKMENMLKAEQEGTIKSVNVSVGDVVEKNNILIEFE
ncbi:MAG: acetyl-CoA carboxylase biotin carboxyl carrier protein subunit [Flavobacteriales bacterium]|jgi:biotin carboxyl carrier protein|nr:acetyl-CoA carboxylase biotin carboxyl carrier protein subunit [Flavobacteriales bacterium]|tara:strand:+ start:860 stop:1360 length:501 start_codon:yes stop_codon:yes gene_type:complete